MSRRGSLNFQNLAFRNKIDASGTNNELQNLNKKTESAPLSTDFNLKDNNRRSSFCISPVSYLTEQGVFLNINKEKEPLSKHDLFIKKKYYEEELSCLASPLKKKHLLPVFKSIEKCCSGPVGVPETKITKAKQMWIHALKLLRPIFRLNNLVKLIQLYGSPAFDDENIKINDMIQSVGKAFLKPAEIKTQETKSNIYDAIKRIWSIVLIFLYLYVAIITPINVTFYSAVDNCDIEWEVTNIIVDLLFGLDIIMKVTNFFGPTRFTIAWNYISSWFLIDLFASFPFQYIYPSSDFFINLGFYNDLLRLIRVPRIFNLFSFATPTKEDIQQDAYSIYIDTMQMNASNHFFYLRCLVLLKLISFASLMLVCTHIVSCLWVYTFNWTPSYQSWIFRNEFQDVSPDGLYLYSFYWAAATIVTVGYGDISARYTSISIYKFIILGEKLVAIFWMMIGACFFAFMMSIMSTILSAADSKRRILGEKHRVINEFCSISKISSKLKEKMKIALDYKNAHYNFTLFENNSILEDIPLSLQYKVKNILIF